MSQSESVASFPGLREFAAGDYDRALPLLLPVAQSGHAEAQCMIGCIYQLGLGSVAPDFQVAIAWYSHAESLGYGVASNNRGELFIGGVCTSVNPRSGCGHLCN